MQMTIEGVRLAVQEAFTRPWRDVLPYLQEIFPEVDIVHDAVAHPPKVTIDHPIHGRMEIVKWMGGTAKVTEETRRRLRENAA